MDDKSYLADLGQKLGLAVLPNARAFKDSNYSGKGIVLGLQSGYLIAAGPVKSGRNKFLGLLVRYRKGSPTDTIQTTLKSLPAFKGVFHGKNLKVTDEGLRVFWSYPFKRPTAEAVGGVLDQIVLHLQGLALPLSGKCEGCCAVLADVTLVSGVPGYQCLSCQARITSEKEREAQEYKDRGANYLAAIPAGILAAAVAGTLWGVFVSAIDAGNTTWTPKLHMFGAIFTGAAVTYVLFKALGKVTRIGQVLATLLTLAGKFWGDTLYFAFDGLWREGQHLSLNFLSWSPESWALFRTVITFVFQNFFKLKLASFDSGFVLLLDVGCAIGILWAPWAKIPTFIPTFESAGRVPERAQQTGSASVWLA